MSFSKKLLVIFFVFLIGAPVLAQETTQQAQFQGWTPIQLAFYSPLQLFPPSKSVYGLRFNIIYGNNYRMYGLNAGLFSSADYGAGISTSVFVNSIKNDFYGFQYATIFNMVHKKMTGIQFAPFFNIVEERMNGIQITIGQNTVYKTTDVKIEEDLLGKKITITLIPGYFNGLQIAVYQNAAGNVNGMQIGGYNNVIASKDGSIPGNVNGVQIGTGGSVADGTVKGFQFAMMNCAGRLYGFQLGILFNMVDYASLFGRPAMGKLFSIQPPHNLYGMQIAGMMNKVDGNITGFQISSIGNITGDDLIGLQVGVLNIATRVKGVQIGVFNYCRSMAGVQIGVINIISQSKIPIFPGINIGFSF